ncbi:hypothetical protein LXH09_05670 [Streptomyces sp. CS7]|uniref:hypothetical protein n=1 Tax=Streptomyces sp. CS-7 TaxID=2906769 RepID=UPI0021B43847|nr:hypothetical protein [Streptomyces sp. CS-7]MCT6776112.1 hypothetical protein [Streptomyces sp. CS-7]
MTTQDDSGTQPGNEGNPPASTAGPTLEEVIADRDRWKALSRQNETNFNTSRTELQQLQTSQEAALEDAKTEGRTSALEEVSTDLVTAELRLQAADAGAELPDLSFLDLNRFTGDNKRPDSGAVKSFIESLPKRVSSGTAFPKLAGASHNKGGNSEFASTDPSDLADYIAGGVFL